MRKTDRSKKFRPKLAGLYAEVSEKRPHQTLFCCVSVPLKG